MTSVSSADNTITVIDGESFNIFAIGCERLIIGNLRAVHDTKRKLVVLNHISVDSQHRRAGVALNLFNHLLTWSIENKAHQIGVFIAQNLLAQCTTDEMSLFLQSAGFEMNGNFGYKNLNINDI